MDGYQYLQNKKWVLESMYEYLVKNKEKMPLREYINYTCFDGLQGQEIIDELYAASYFMWFYLLSLHEFSIDITYVDKIDKIISYLEAEKETLLDNKENDIDDDINELKKMKQNIEEQKQVKMDFMLEMQKMDNDLRIWGQPSFQIYGKSNHNINLETAKNVLFDISSNCAIKFLCLATYFKICMYEEIQFHSDILNCLVDFFNKYSDEEILTSFKGANENNVKEYIGFLRRCNTLHQKMSKDTFIGILDQKGVKYKADNFVDRIEIGNILIALNTTCGNDTKIPQWHIKIVENKIYYTIAQFDNRYEAYKYYLENHG